MRRLAKVQVALVVPVKSFDIAKGRLADVLTATQRADLAQRCAETVLRAGAPWPVYVVCESDAVSDWAKAHGARVVRQSTHGLNAAVDAGCEVARSDGADHIVIAHGDLPLAVSFAHLVVPGSVTVVPDRHRQGTNVVAVPATSAFTFRFGVDSFSHHCEQAGTDNIDIVVVDDESLALDLDTADDLNEFKTRMENHR